MISCPVGRSTPFIAAICNMFCHDRCQSSKNELNLNTSYCEVISLHCPEVITPPVIESPTEAFVLLMMAMFHTVDYYVFHENSINFPKDRMHRRREIGKSRCVVSLMNAASQIPKLLRNALRTSRLKQILRFQRRRQWERYRLTEKWEIDSLPATAGRDFYAVYRLWCLVNNIESEFSDNSKDISRFSAELQSRRRYMNLREMITARYSVGDA